MQAYDRTIAAIRSAGYRPDQWQTAIDMLADATGSKLGELIGWVGADRLPTRLITRDRMDEEPMLARWDAVGGHRPDVNPMIARGMHAAPLDTIIDTDLIDADRRRHHILWNEVFDPSDIPHLGSVLLRRDGDTHLVIGVLRTRAQGPLTGTNRRLFDACARQAATAAAFARHFGEESGRLVARAMEAMETPAIALNGFGRVVGITRRADALIGDSPCLRLQSGRLRCADRRQENAFTRLLSGGLYRGLTGSLLLRSAGQLLRVSLHQLDGELDLGYNARIILVLEDLSDQLSLTPAKVEILALLRQGLRVNAIAALRGVSTGTVRSQTKAIYAKLGAAGQVELLRRD